MFSEFSFSHSADSTGDCPPVPGELPGAPGDQCAHHLSSRISFCNPAICAALTSLHCISCTSLSLMFCTQTCSSCRAIESSSSFFRLKLASLRAFSSAHRLASRSCYSCSSSRFTFHSLWASSLDISCLLVDSPVGLPPEGASNLPPSLRTLLLDTAFCDGRLGGWRLNAGCQPPAAVMGDAPRYTSFKNCLSLSSRDFAVEDAAVVV